MSTQLTDISQQLEQKGPENFWPFKHSVPRKTQTEVLQWITELPSHIKYILTEIPVGGGKSPLAINYSGWLNQFRGDSYILTPQKILQKQYEDSFESQYLSSLYGKSNYTCAGKKTNCEIGDMIKPKCEACPHKQAFQSIRTSPNVVLNYTLALLMFKYIKDKKLVPKRKLIICDEAHTFENYLCELNSAPFSEFRSKQIKTKFYSPTSFTDALEWVTGDYINALKNKISQLNNEMTDIIAYCENTGNPPTRDEMQKMSLLMEFERHHDMIFEELISPPKEEVAENFVFVSESKTSFKFKELYGRRSFASVVEPMAEKFLFMSSTILDKKAFCEDLGLNPENAAFISVDSEFKIENRPIFYMPRAKMSYGWDSPERKKDRTDMLSAITTLAKDVHGDENGVIHTGSFQIAKWLCENLDNKIPHKILHHNPGSNQTRDAVIAEYQIDDGVPKLLISPSVTEGLDLKDDKGRWAVFAKVPYPFLGDAWIKKRMSLSDTWYQRQALIAMIQGGGRVVRHNDDWGHVYIFDSTFDTLLSRSKKLIPDWWFDSIQF